MIVRVLDLDGSITAQKDFVERNGAEVVPMSDLGPLVRICCSFASFERFEAECAKRFSDGHAIAFCGSGDFHHVTVALLRRIKEPFNLLILDKHPDWARGAPIMHCGTWVSHVLRLPNFRNLYHMGGDLDFDNFLRHFAPWPLLREGHIKVVPAVRHYTRQQWQSVPNEPMRRAPSEPMSAERLERLCADFRTELARYPLYVSIDKDLMRPADSVVNWDSGVLNLDEVLLALSWFLKAAGGRLIGMDVMGDWAKSNAQGILRRVLNITEHPRLRIDPAAAAAQNSRTNQSILNTVRRAIS